MQKMFVEQSNESRAVWLYDQTVPLAERPDKKLYFPSMMAAGNFLGIDPRHVWQSMCNNHKPTSKRDGKKYAIKPAPSDQEKSKPMEEIKITIPDGKNIADLFQESVKIMERIKHWSEQPVSKHTELKKELWLNRRDEFLNSLNIRKVNNE